VQVPTITSTIDGTISATPPAPAVTVAQQDQLLPNVDPTSVDSVPMDNVINNGTTTNANFWNGVL
jgi:hypothetical protein